MKRFFQFNGLAVKNNWGIKTNYVFYIDNSDLTYLRKMKEITVLIPRVKND